ncbi:MAG: hypothetical protein PWP03_244 [Candidatus Woesearchaeota archaeon]|nr:hypothetical protein [Candidatus Woesearchaeota archaeon]MDN5327606.1 hypothetical protein [Candidatus Woesearchaeota archaeon]
MPDFETLNEIFRNLSDFINIKGLVLFVFKDYEEFNSIFDEYLSTLKEFYSGFVDLRQYLAEAKEIIKKGDSYELFDPSLTPLERRVIEMYLPNSENYDVIEFLDHLIDKGVSFQKQPLSYIYSSLISARNDKSQGLLLLHYDSETFLFDILKGFSDHILFYYPLTSGRKGNFLPESEIEKDDFFSWLLVYFNKNIGFNGFESNNLKQHLAKFRAFLDGTEKIPFLEPIRPLIYENLEAYRNYDLLSILKFGFELNNKNAGNLFDYVMGTNPDLNYYFETIPTDKLGVYFSINNILNTIDYLVVDYTNKAEEGIYFGNFFSLYAVPFNKFRRYVENGDLYVLEFLYKGSALKPFRDPKKDVKFNYSTERLDEMMKFNKKHIKQFEKFFEQSLENSDFQLKKNNLANTVAYILSEQIKPYSTFIKAMDIKFKISSDKNQFKRLLKMYTYGKKE